MNKPEDMAVTVDKGTVLQPVAHALLQPRRKLI